MCSIFEEGRRLITPGAATPSVNPTKAIALSLVIFLSMIINMAAAALSGAVIPIILKSFGRDPA